MSTSNGRSRSTTIDSPASYDYSTYLRTKFQQGNWFGVFRSDWKYLSFLESCFIAHLLNRGLLMADDDGWIVLSKAHVQSLNLPDLESLLESLEAKGIIELKLLKHTRFLRINLDTLTERTDDD